MMNLVRVIVQIGAAVYVVAYGIRFLGRLAQGAWLAHMRRWDKEAR